MGWIGVVVTIINWRLENEAVDKVIPAMMIISVAMPPVIRVPPAGA
jgi:hypothetical protein